MGNLLTPTITVGPIILGLSVLLALTCIVIRLSASSPIRWTAALRFAACACLTGVAGFIGGTMIGIAAFCSFASSGNLCGLGGIFGTGPLVAGIGVA